MKNFYSQDDEEWKSMKRYHKSSTDQLQLLDKRLLRCINAPSEASRQYAWNAFEKFKNGISDLIENGMDDDKGTNGYSLYNYGCWDCTIAMIINHFGKRVYYEILPKCIDHRKKRKSDSATPRTVIESLRSMQLLSPIGFSFDMYNDLVSLITKKEVQILLHEDYGASGVNTKDATVLQYSLKYKELVGVALCVLGHPAFGKKEDTHWVYVDPNESTKDNIMIFDPSDEPSDDKPSTKLTLDYKKVYEVCVYSTPENIKKTLKC